MNKSKSGSPVNLIETAANDNSFTTLSKELVAAELGETLQGQSATIKMVDRKVMIDAASGNGVIQAVDAVLIPTKH